MTFNLTRELGMTSAGHDQVRKKLIDAEHERDILRRRLEHVERAYETKSMLYDTIRVLFEELLVGFELQPGHDVRGCFRYGSRLSPLKE
jgi:hypothetical protein